MRSGVSEATADLPVPVRQILAEVVENATGALGDTLRAIVLFGSAAENRLRATSDVNLLIVVTRFDPERVASMRPVLQRGHAAVRLAVMWLAERELAVAGEAFAVKFADIVRRHRVLYGAVPLEGLAISRQSAIVRVRQVLLNLVLRLRSTYALESDHEERLAAAVADAIGPVRASAVEILVLEGRPAPTPREALESVARAWSETKASGVLQAVREARERKTLAPGTAASVLLDVIDLAGYLHGRAAALS